MSNFATAISATETAENSAGSAMKENSKYMESLSAKLNALKGNILPDSYYTAPSTSEYMKLKSTNLIPTSYVQVALGLDGSCFPVAGLSITSSHE